MKDSIPQLRIMDCQNVKVRNSIFVSYIEIKLVSQKHTILFIIFCDIQEGFKLVLSHLKKFEDNFKTSNDFLICTYEC